MKMKTKTTLVVGVVFNFNCHFDLHFKGLFLHRKITALRAKNNYK